MFFSLEFLVTMLTVKKIEGKTIENLTDIWTCVGRKKIVMDLVNILLLIIDVSVDLKVMTWLRLFIFVKLPDVLRCM